MAPTKMQQWSVLNKDNGFDGLTFGEVPVPKVGDNDVLVKFHAASLNYRDLIIPKVSLCHATRGAGVWCVEQELIVLCRERTPSP